MKVKVEDYPRSLTGEDAGEVHDVSREQLLDAVAAISPLYEAMTGPDWLVIAEELGRQVQEATAQLLFAKGDDVVRNQATIRVLQSLLDLPQSLASDLRNIQEGLSTDG